MTHSQRKEFIDPDHPKLSITRQVELLDISRSSIYYEKKVSEEDIRTMHAIDEIYTDRPFYGSRRIKGALEDDHAIFICRDHVRRLMREMGLETIYPKKTRSTSCPDPAHRIYPYLLRGMKARYPNHIWGTDITYIRLERGWTYLVALLDWYSRYVIAWRLSPFLEVDFCIENLKEALEIAIPEIHNSDQGSQFTANEYVNVLKEHEIGISMDGRGRCGDNIFTERLWRTVKYENVYLRSYQDIDEARQGLSEYFSFYNTKRRHGSLNDRTPASVYFGSENEMLNQIFKVEVKNQPLVTLS